MAAKDLASKLIELLETRAIENGFDLVTVEQAGGQHAPLIRVLLDCDGGVGIEVLQQANAWVTEAIDESGVLPGAYTLEVSSPGIDRPLRKREDFTRFAGETVTVKTHPEPGARSAWTGRLDGLDGDDVVLDIEGSTVRIPFVSIVKARVKGVVRFDEKGA